MNTPIFHPQNGECLGVVSGLKMTRHALDRWQERFSYLELAEELENSKPATRSQRKAIASTSSISYDHKNNTYQVSSAGVVFVIRNDCIVTVFPIVSSACGSHHKRNHRTKKFMKYN